jgi:hypothetical protein
MIKVPGVTDRGRGVASASLTEHVDLMATLAAAGGLPQPLLCPNDSRNVLLCTEGISVLPLAADPSLVLRKAVFSQWPHPFSQRPAAMGYSMRTNTSRYTEWVLMTYDESGTHVPDWSTVCGRELYILGRGVGLTESLNLADDPAAATEIRALSQRLHAGWRVASGSGAWPRGLTETNQTTLTACPMNNEPVPEPRPPAPPPSPPGSPVAGHSRTCINTTAQDNPQDTTCWCRPAVTHHVRDYPACAALCASDPACLSWSFDSKGGGGCFRHSTNATYSRSVPGTGEPHPTVWSGCEHPIVCPESGA